MPEAAAVATMALIHRSGPRGGTDALDGEDDSGMGSKGGPSRGGGPRGILLLRAPP
jgi:hypothetical protein